MCQRHIRDEAYNLYPGHYLNSYADKQTNDGQWDITTTTYAPPYVVVEKKNFPSPKEDSVTDLGLGFKTLEQRTTVAVPRVLNVKWHLLLVL